MTAHQLPPALAARLAADPELWRDFNDICDCGGRLAGTPRPGLVLQGLDLRAQGRRHRVLRERQDAHRAGSGPDLSRR